MRRGAKPGTQTRPRDALALSPLGGQDSFQEPGPPRLPPPRLVPRPAPQRAADPQPGRVRSLDGLRGLAALVVVLNHALISVVPAMANTYVGAPPPKPGSSLWWLGYTPARFVWAGPEAVVLFFVLSGFVLALPAVRRGLRWFDASYYPRRLIRLYVPVWGALLFVVLLRTVLVRTVVPGGSWWLNLHTAPMSRHDWLTSAGLVHESNGWEFTSVLWSLKWEVLFSLLLPVALLFPVLTRRQPAIAGAGIVAGLVVVFLGAAHGNGWAQMLPIFMIGSVLAFQAERLRGRSARRRPLLVGCFLAGLTTLVAIALMTAPYWLLLPQIKAARLGPGDLYALSRIAVVVGACLILSLALVLPTWGRTLETRALQWLGSRSYSLYLIHEPVVVSTAFLLGGRPAVGPYLVAAVGASLLLTELFWRGVEHPSVLGARWVGRMFNIGLRSMFVQEAPRRPVARPAAPAAGSAASPRGHNDEVEGAVQVRLLETEVVEADARRERIP